MRHWVKSAPVSTLIAGSYGCSIVSYHQIFLFKRKENGVYEEKIINVNIVLRILKYSNKRVFNSKP